MSSLSPLKKPTIVDVVRRFETRQTIKSMSNLGGRLQILPDEINRRLEVSFSALRPLIANLKQIKRRDVNCLHTATAIHFLYHQSSSMLHMFRYSALHAGARQVNTALPEHQKKQLTLVYHHTRVTAAVIYEVYQLGVDLASLAPFSGFFAFTVAWVLLHAICHLRRNNSQSSHFLPPALTSLSLVIHMKDHWVSMREKVSTNLLRIMLSLRFIANSASFTFSIPTLLLLIVSLHTNNIFSGDYSGLCSARLG